MTQGDKFLQERLDGGLAPRQPDVSSKSAGTAQLQAHHGQVRSRWLGRARRKEFIPVMLGANFAAKIFDTNIDATVQAIAFLVICIVVIIESIRRLHDMGRSGWWSPLFFIPFVWIWGWRKGVDGPNEYGPDPRA